MTVAVERKVSAGGNPGFTNVTGQRRSAAVLVESTDQTR